MKALGALINGEARMIVRDTAGLLIPLLLPMLILVTSALPSQDVQVGDGLTALEVGVLPIVFTMVVTMTGVLNMPSFVATYRRTGVLRRLAVTPVQPLLVLLAQAIVGVALTLMGIALAYGVAAIGFDAQAPRHVGTALAVFAATIAAMYALGMIVAALAPTPNASVAIGLVAFLLLAALGGMFGSTENLPDAVARVGEWLPFGAAVDGLAAAWTGEDVPRRVWLALGGSTVVGVVVSSLTFRWDR